MIEFLMYLNFIVIVMQLGIMAVGWLTCADYYENMSRSLKDLYWMFNIVFVGSLFLTGIILYSKVRDVAFAFSEMLHAILILSSIIYGIVLVVYAVKLVLNIRSYFGKKRNRL